MVNSYIGRLILIYALAVALVFGALYSFYGEWLDQRVDDLSTIVKQCDLCPFEKIYNRDGLPALIDDLEVRFDETNLRYSILKGDNVISGSLIAELQKNKTTEPFVAQGHITSRNLTTYTSQIELDDNYRLLAEFHNKVAPSKEQVVLRDNLLGLTNQVIFMGVGFIILGLIATTIIGWKIHTRLNLINATANSIITSQDLGLRIPSTDGNNEFDQLTSNLNNMLGNIEARVEDIRQMSNNIAHDLRTPLTKLRGDLEQLETQKDMVGGLTQQVDQILDTFNALLRISHLESGSARISLEEVNLGIIIRDAVELFMPLAEEKEQSISIDVTQLAIKADKNLLFQALLNLLENAVKYAPVGAEIEVVARRHNDRIIIDVKDSGVGIPGEMLSTVMERFVRLDEARGTHGNGLGLSMVRAIAEVHNGQLFLYNRADGFSAVIDIPL